MTPLVLWLPKPPDNANARLHWAAANRLKRRYQGELTTRRQAKLIPPPPPEPLARVTIEIEWHYPNRRHRLDDDNAIRRLKPAADWLVRHGYLVNDTADCVTWTKPEHVIGASTPPLSTVRLTLLPA